MGRLSGSLVFLVVMLPSILAINIPLDKCKCPQQCEVNLHYYLHQFRAGPNHPNRNEEFVISAPGMPLGFGSGLIHDWSLTTGLSPTENIVGRAQGWHIVADLGGSFWYTSQNIIFLGSKFAGSTLQVMGVINGTETGVGEWSVMGGTGEFTRASGNIWYKAIQKQDVEWIRELDIQVFYTPKDGKCSGYEKHY